MKEAVTLSARQSIIFNTDSGTASSSFQKAACFLSLPFTINPVLQPKVASQTTEKQLASSSHTDSNSSTHVQAHQYILQDETHQHIQGQNLPRSLLSTYTFIPQVYTCPRNTSSTQLTAFSLHFRGCQLL